MQPTILFRINQEDIALQSIQTRRIVMFVFILLAAALFVLGMMILPDTIITQFGRNTGDVSTMPKMLALAIPSVLCILFSVLFYRKGKSKDLAIAILGLVLFGLAFFVNR
jgi:cytochrome bd-type quinol oxidase subunit 2